VIHNGRGPTAVIAGVGASPQGKFPGSTDLSLATQAVVALLDDCGIAKDDIDGLLTMPGTTSHEPAKHYLELGEHLGINPKVPVPCKWVGRRAARSCNRRPLRRCRDGEAVLCVFGDAAKTGGSRFSAAPGRDPSWKNWGMFGNAANSAMGATRHMALYGTTSEQLGWVAVNGRRNASMNPDAVMRTPITIEDHQSSRWIVEPLHLFDCCLITDGGVAVLVTSPERARDLRQPPVSLLGMGQGHTLETLAKKDWWYLPHQQDCISRAYRMAGLSRRTSMSRSFMTTSRFQSCSG